MDFHAEGQRYAAHALHQQGWLHGGICCARRPRRDATANRSGVPLRWRRGVRRDDAEPFAGGEGIVPGVEVARRGGGPQPAPSAGSASMSCRAELPEFWIARSALSPRKRACASVAEAQQGADLRPPGHHETTVPAGSAAAADVLLQYQDPCVRFQLFEGDGGPEPDETAADYRHVRRVGADEGGAGGVPPGRSSASSGWGGVRGGVSVSFMARVRGR